MDFYDQWTHASSYPLASILRRAQHLQSLTFAASNSPYDTPWTRLNLQDDALRGISLGLETIPAEQLPVFHRLSRLELQTISTANLEILLSRAPNLRSLTVSLPDGLTNTELEAFLDALRHVPNVRDLTVSIADWAPCSEGAGGLDHVRDVLEMIARRLPLLETLDLRTRSYDIVEGILDFKPVDVDSLEFEVSSTRDVQQVTTSADDVGFFLGFHPSHASVLQPSHSSSSTATEHDRLCNSLIHQARPAPPCTREGLMDAVHRLPGQHRRLRRPLSLPFCCRRARHSRGCRRTQPPHHFPPEKGTRKHDGGVLQHSRCRFYGEADHRIRYCREPHGPDGRSFHGFLPTLHAFGLLRMLPFLDFSFCFLPCFVP